ncbi:MAG TPA: hypothetical protein VMI12_12175 [Puia sp.]|nr:hypothetical protein [Puia sp.]
MKKNLFFLILMIVIGFAGYSQKLRLNAYGNYVFNDGVESYSSSTSYFNGTIQGGFLWGAGLEIRVKEYYGAELMYFRQDTKAPVQYYDYNLNRARNSTFDMGINWIMIGGARSLRASEKVEPYGGLMLGAAIIDAKNEDNQNSNSVTKFAWGLRLGTNIWASEVVGLKLQAMLLSAVQGAGGSLYFGTGGAGAGVSTYSTMLQFVIGGGLTFKFGAHSNTGH